MNTRRRQAGEGGLSRGAAQQHRAWRSPYQTREAELTR